MKNNSWIPRSPYGPKKPPDAVIAIQSFSHILRSEKKALSFSLNGFKMLRFTIRPDRQLRSFV